MTAADLLREAKSCGWRLRLDGDRVICRPTKKGPPDLLERLRQRKPELRALLAANDADPGGHRLSDAEAWQAITEAAKQHGLDPDTLADGCCLFGGELVLWTESPTRQTDGTSTGRIALFPDLVGLETVAQLLARGARLDTAGPPLVDAVSGKVKCQDCTNWRTLEHHPQMGNCSAGVRPSGQHFWGPQERRCDSFAPKVKP